MKRKKRREEDDKKGRHKTRRNPWPHVAWNLVGATESHKWCVLLIVLTGKAQSAIYGIIQGRS